MANSYVRYTGNGSTTAFSIPFSYIDSTHLACTVNGASTTFTLNAAGTTATLAAAPASGAAIEFKRTTSQTSRLTDYVAGSVLKEDDLDTDSLQGFYMSQEALDDANDVISTDNTDFQWDVNNKRLKNLATPTASTDAATKGYIDTSTTSAATSATNAAASATAAAASATAAASSETNAATSETNSSTSETNASNSATSASTSATTATTKATQASSSATNAATSETNAASSATAASGSASTATTKASEASTSASNAATSETNASNSATTASTAATNASTSETNAASSATSASSSASTATTKASEASTSATNAASSATTASSASSTATTKASEASTSATNAASSASTATTKASEASTSASNAATSETNASNSASAASTSATNAGNSATAAATSAASAAAAYDTFDDRYLGSKTSNPTVDNDGNALVTGALYFNSTANEMRVFDGGNWIAASSAGTASLILYEYTATSGQTTFSGSDDNSSTLSYSVDNLQVVLNGVILDPSDYTATTGTSIVLGSGAATGDLLNVYAFKSFTVSEINANNLNDGTVPDARFPATLPAISGANLTNLDASDLASGTVPIARIGASGTKDSTTFFRGDNTFATVTIPAGTTINNNADNRVITGSGTANTLEGEANLIFDGSKLGVNVTPVRHFHLHDDTQPYLHMTNNTTGTTTGDGFDILIDSSTGKAIFNQRENQPIEFMTNNNARIKIDESGHLLPTVSNSRDLGSSSLVWRNIYTSDFHMSNENLDKGNEVDGTKGSWTFQEGADDLFLLNNKNGKKYKFNLTELE